MGCGLYCPLKREELEMRIKVSLIALLLVLSVSMAAES
jgi:hypothetical protein